MRIDNRKSKDKKKKPKQKQSVLEKEMMNLISKSLKTALDVALDDIFKGWK